MEDRKMKSEKNPLIRNLVIAILFVTLSLTIVLVYRQKENQIGQLNMQKDGLYSMIEKRDSLVNEMAKAFDEIENNLTFVRNKRSQLTVANPEGKFDRKQAVIDDIKLMNTMLEESSKKIAELDKKLKDSGIQLASFKNKIAQLNKNIEEQNENIAALTKMVEERDRQVAQLNNRVGSLETEVSSKNDSIKQKTQIIKKHEDEKNTAYLAYGTFKELKENGVLTKDGGFLGLGRNKTLKNDFDNSYFTTLDIREVKEIPLFSKKVNIITEHPDSSYHFVQENGLYTYLEIENPQEFWRYSRYAVIEVK